MASFVSAGSFYGADTMAGTQTGVGVPDDYQAGDIMLLWTIAGFYDTTNPVPVPKAADNWNQVMSPVTLADGSQFGAWWKRCSGSSGEGTWVSGDSLYEYLIDYGDETYASAGCVCFRGFTESGSPIHAVSAAGLYQTDNTTLRAATLTTTVPTWLVFLGASGANPVPTQTPPTNYTEDVDYNTGSVYKGLYANHYDRTSWTGTTGAVDATLSGSATLKHAILIALTLPSTTPTIVASQVGSDIQVSWSGTTADTISIERKDGAGDYAEVYADAWATSPFTDSTGLSDGVVYKYRARSTTDGVTSEYSNEETVNYALGGGGHGYYYSLYRD